MRALIAAAAVAPLVAWVRTTRATREESRRTLPGDELVPTPMWQATRGITIRTPRVEVWPWIVQMGFPTSRAGWYTPAWLDRLLFGIRTPSADRIVPELQDLAVGDRVSDSADGHSYFTVARLDAPQTLVLLSHTHPLPPYRDVDFAWAFVLDDQGPRTRLLMRARVRYVPVWPAALVRALIVVGFGVGDIIQAGGMLHGIRARAERGTASR